jgi:hypothetical protein
MSDVVVRVGEACGDHSFVGDICVEGMLKYSTWVRDEAERNLVAKCIWEGWVNSDRIDFLLVT